MRISPFTLCFFASLTFCHAVNGAATPKTAFVLQGSPSIYYPVFFQDGNWNDGTFLLNIYRIGIHDDETNAGSLMVQTRSHSSAWGHGSDFLEYEVYTVNTMAAGLARTHYAQGVVAWLRGGRTYYYDSNHSVQISHTSGSGAELVTYDNPTYNVHEAFQNRTEIPPDFEYAGGTGGKNFRIPGYLTLGSGSGDFWGKWMRHGEGNYTSGPLFLGANRYGNAVSWDSDALFVGLSDEGADRKDAIVAWGDNANDSLRFLFNGGDLMRLTATGNLGIGTTNPTHKLAVNGTIKAKEVIVETTGWSDYVFTDDYALAPLSEVEAHIKEHKHLPGIPSAAQVAEQGVSVGDMQARLLAKIEELTLHIIAQEKRISEQGNEIRLLKTQAK